MITYECVKKAYDSGIIKVKNDCILVNGKVIAAYSDCCILIKGDAISENIKPDCPAPLNVYWILMKLANCGIESAKQVYEDVAEYLRTNMDEYVFDNGIIRHKYDISDIVGYIDESGKVVYMDEKAKSNPNVQRVIGNGVSCCDISLLQEAVLTLERISGYYAMFKDGKLFVGQQL